MKKINITNIIATVLLIMGCLMFIGWYYKSMLFDSELIGLESKHFYYTFGFSIVLFLVPEKKLTEIIIKGIEKKLDIKDQNENLK